MAEPGSLQALTHQLLNHVRNAEIDVRLAGDVAALLALARAKLAPHVWGGPYAVEQLRAPDEGFRFRADPLAETIPFGPLLGPRNPIAPPSRIWLEGPVVAGVIRFSPVHAGPMGLVHGGALSGLLDEILALAVLAKGFVGFTRSLDVQFFAPAPLGEEIALRAECAGRAGSELLARAELRFGGKLLASGAGIFR